MECVTPTHLTGIDSKDPPPPPTRQKKQPELVFAVRCRLKNVDYNCTLLKTTLLVYPKTLLKVSAISKTQIILGHIVTKQCTLGYVVVH